MNTGSPSHFEQLHAEQNSPSQTIVLSTKPSRAWKKYLLPVGGTLLLLIGIISGVILVLQNQNILKKAAGSWSITNSHCLSCSGLNCTLTCTTQGNLSNGLSCNGAYAARYNCASLTGDGKCFQNENVLGGSYSPGQSVDLNSMLGVNCGYVQIDFQPQGVAPNSGSCGGVILYNPTCSGGETPPTGGGPVTTPPPKSVCGEKCTTASDCQGSTVPGISVACRAGLCVNQECSNLGGQTVFGTRCDCVLNHGCGDECGADIGLCGPGFTCTYRAQSQCGVVEHGVCVPPGNQAGTARGPIISVPQYQNAYFERRQCGGTRDGDNNYIYHPSFPNHAFTTAEIMSLICNPVPTMTPTPTPTASPTPSPTPSSPPEDLVAQCTDIRAYDLTWNLLTAQDLSQLQPGDKVRFTVRGDTSSGQLSQARFTLNGNLRSPVTTKRPGSANEFYDEITIPDFSTGQNTLTIQIKAELYHTGLARWF